MRKLLILLLTVIMSSGLSGCAEKKQVITLKEEVRANFTDEKAIEVETLIRDFINWNNHLDKVDWSDVDSINQVSSDLSIIYEKYNTLKDGMNINNKKGLEQYRCIVPFSQIAFNINIMLFNSAQGKYSDMNNEQIKQYFIKEDFEGIRNAAYNFFKKCDNEEKLRETFVLHEEAWAEYFSILRERIYYGDTPGNYWGKNIMIPKFK